MKKSLLLYALLSFAGTVLVADAEYQITQVSNPGVSAGAPVVNESGQMAWAGYDGSSYDIYFYDGLNILRLETPGVYDRFPQMNDAGQIVWEGFEAGLWVVFLFDGAVIEKLTADGCGGNNPEINNSGVVVWSGNCDPRSMYRDIYVYDGTTVQVIDGSGGINVAPQINERGEIVWVSYDGSWNIYLLHEGEPVRISDPSYRDDRPQINDAGDVAWVGNDGSDWDLYYYDGTSVTRIENPGYYNFCTPSLNMDGSVVWEAHDGTDWEVFLYDGQTVVPLTDNSFDDRSPQINNEGYVVWEGFDGTDWEIFLYDGIRVEQVTDNTTDDKYPQVNAKGAVAWSGSGGDGVTAVFFVEPVDSTPPVIRSVDGPDMLWPPNHKMVPVVLSVVVEDDTDPEPVTRIIEVTSNEPETGCGPGDKGPDWEVTGDLTLNLRAERCGDGPGRIYTITVECEDASGNTSTEEIAVTVPHSRGKK